MKLFKELTEDVKFLIEEKDGKKDYFVEGICLQAEKVNKNKRKYPKGIMEREVNRYNEEYVKTKRAFGELGHPEGPKINETLVSHYFVSLKESGNDYVCRAKIMDTPNGKIIKNFIDEGVNFGISSRGMGSLKEVNGINEVQEDFWLATAGDIVLDPSGPDCWLNGIMEGVEWIWDNGVLKAHEVEQFQAKIEESVKSRELTQQRTFQLFEAYVRKLASKPVI